MATPRYTSIDDYLEAQPSAARRALTKVRAVLRRALPRAEETISYQIPSFKLPTGTVIYFAGWKAHYAVYPATAGVMEAYAKTLSKYEVSKGTIRFPYDEPVPSKLLEGIAKVRAKETDARAAKKKRKAAPKRAAAAKRA